MEKGRYDGYDTVVLFGSIMDERPRAWCFASEDEGEGIWMSKRIADWDYDVGAMTMPRWLARKHKLIGEPLPDDHPAWSVILKASPTFLASKITVVKR